MAHPIDRDLIRSLFIHDIPLMDVRAPLEFAQGAFPNAVNYPLMTDQERHEVGICYQQHGQDAAIKLGHKLVSGDIKQQRMAQWQAFAEQHPKGYLYCFRGGLRSRTTQQWLQESGVKFPLVNGGYKAMRRVLLDELEQAIKDSRFVVLGGKTGTGKTWLLKELSHALDLEGMANHRGSSFGRLPDGQPAQIDFENTLAISLMKYHHKGIQHFWVEDESRMIGSVSLPQSLQKKMQLAPLVMLEEDLQYRISITLKDYVIDLENYYRNYVHKKKITEPAQVSDHFEMFADYLLASLERIQKRLGGERYQNIRKRMKAAIDEQRHSGVIDLHRDWIEALLTSYYDPMYDYQLEKKQHRIVFRGNSHQIKANQVKILDLG